LAASANTASLTFKPRGLPSDMEAASEQMKFT